MSVVPLARGPRPALAAVSTTPSPAGCGRARRSTQANAEVAAAWHAFGRGSSRRSRRPNDLPAGVISLQESIAERGQAGAADDARRRRAAAADRLRQHREPAAGARRRAVDARSRCAPRSAPGAAASSGRCSPRASCCSLGGAAARPAPRLLVRAGAARADAAGLPSRTACASTRRCSARRRRSRVVHRPAVRARAGAQPRAPGSRRGIQGRRRAIDRVAAVGLAAAGAGHRGSRAVHAAAGRRRPADADLRRAARRRSRVSTRAAC